MLPLISRLLLAAVLACAAAAKLRDRAGAARAAEDLGVPRALAGPVAVVLPVAELVIAAGLLPGATAVAAGWAALALLALFTVAIGLALLRGRAPVCHCFGELSAAPAGRGTLARNAALLGAAVVVAAAGPGASAWQPEVGAAVAFGALAAGSGAVLLRLFAAHGRALERLDALEAAVGRPAPDAGPPVGAPAPAAERLAVEPGRTALLLFTDPGCGPCRALEPVVAGWRERDELAVTVADERTAAAYGRPATPSAVLVGPDGRIASPLTSGPDAIRALVAAALDAAAARARALATPLRAPSGETTAPDALGEEVVLLFWNPGCGRCRAMEDDLRALDGGPRLLLIAAGGEEPGLPFPLLRDPDRALARAFGATGTPMAVRLDADGRPASGLVAGAGAVLALLRPRPVLEVLGAAR